YDCMLFDMDSLDTVNLRASDGVLLSVAADIPLYIDTALFMRQSTPLSKDGATSIAMPANIASEEMLRMALENAVSREDYELASQLRDELNRRRHAQSNEQQ
ncbi:MAG: UvrB/UvrC motif-containing protein, partial [Prevotella sp.]